MGAAVGEEEEVADVIGEGGGVGMGDADPGVGGDGRECGGTI